jgi:hypothetical protein
MRVTLTDGVKKGKDFTPPDLETVERDLVLLALYARGSFLPRWFIKDIDKPK